MSLATPKVFLDAATQDMYCKGCGKRKPLKVPAPMMDVVKEMRAFDLEHVKCPEPKEEE